MSGGLCVVLFGQGVCVGGGCVCCYLDWTEGVCVGALYVLLFGQGEQQGPNGAVAFGSDNECELGCLGT